MDLKFAYHLATTLMKVHGVPNDWSFEFDGGKRRYGCCHFSKKKITISRHLVENKDTKLKVVKNVILHEIAHALVGYEADHNELWQACAKRIGCDGERYSSYKTMMPGAKRIRCPCGKIREVRYRYTSKMKNSICVKCRGRLYVE